MKKLEPTYYVAIFIIYRVDNRSISRYIYN